MDFGTALKQMRSGQKLTRSEWDEPERLVSIDHDDQDEEILVISVEPVKDQGRTNLLFNPTISDIMALDWELEDIRNA